MTGSGNGTSRRPVLSAAWRRVLGGSIAVIVGASVGVAAFIDLPAGSCTSLADGWASRSSGDDRDVLTLAISYVILFMLTVAGGIWLTGTSSGAGARLQGLRSAAVTATLAGLILGFGVYLVMALSGGWEAGSCGGHGSWFSGVVVLATPTSWVAAVGLWAAYLIGRKVPA